MNPIANVFSQAIEVLDDTWFICVAIRSLILSQRCDPIDGIVAMEIVWDKLGEFNTLESWLADKHELPNLPMDQFRAKMTETRKAWLKNLVAEYDESF